MRQLPKVLKPGTNREMSEWMDRYAKNAEPREVSEDRE